MTHHDEVLFTEVKGNGGHLGLITLNRPAVLNSLNLTMIHVLSAQLDKWANDQQIKAVVIRAVEGRAFCAGGDIRSTYEHMQRHDMSILNFFRDEYLLNKKIFHYPKPYVALLDGITMGGGVGISIHGSHRVATDRLLFAMPETGIGFFPDVGGTYFLPRLPHHIGYYLGLSGARINCDDAVDIGLIQHKVQSHDLENIIAAIAHENFSNDANASVTRVLQSFEQKVENAKIRSLFATVEQCFMEETMEAITTKLACLSDEIADGILAELNKKSPLSLKVSLRAMQEGARRNFDECMMQEYRLVARFLQGHDFVEGIRAVIIDKDQCPQWQPDTLERVSADAVNSYFAPLSQELTY